MIPIRNLYYLFLYAWDRFSEGSRIEVGIESSPDLPNLLARVLAFGVSRQLGRGLDRRYVEHVDDLAHPRGKFLLPETVKRSSSASGRLVCQFDELSIDTHPNRIIRSAIRRLRSSDGIATDLSAKLQRLDARLDGVSSLPLTPNLFRSLQITRSQGQYALLMNVCRMVMDISLPNEVGTGHRFYDVLEDDVKMSTVFEQFIRNFYRVEQNHYAVAAEAIDWPAACTVPGQIAYLPEMFTDVTLRSANRNIIIDAKFYKQTFTVNRFGGHPKVRSAHLYQLQSYLEHSRKSSVSARSEGILLYPSVDGHEVSLDFQLPRHRIRVCTLDLSRPWQHVHNELLEFVKPLDR